MLEILTSMTRDFIIKDLPFNSIQLALILYHSMVILRGRGTSF